MSKYTNITIFIDEHPSGKGFVLSTLGYHSDDPDDDTQPDDDTGWDSEEADTKAEALKIARFMGKRMVDDKEAKSVTVLFRGGDIGGCEARRGKKAVCKLSPRRWEQTGKLGGAPAGLKVTLRDLFVAHIDEMYEYPNEGPDALRLLPGMKTLIRDTGPDVKRDLDAAQKGIKSDWARGDETWRDFDPESFEITLRALREQVLNASKAQVRQYINELDRYLKR